MSLTLFIIIAFDFLLIIIDFEENLRRLLVLLFENKHEIFYSLLLSCFKMYLYQIISKIYVHLHNSLICKKIQWNPVFTFMVYYVGLLIMLEY